MACIGTIIVSPQEEYIAGSYWFNWRKNLDPLDDTVDSVIGFVLDENDEDVTSSILPAGVIIDTTAKRTTGTMKNFVAGKSYNVYHTIISTLHNRFTDYIIVHCNVQ